MWSYPRIIHLFRTHTGHCMMSQHFNHRGSRGRGRRRGRSYFNVTAGATRIGRATNYMHLPVGLRRGQRYIPSGDYITPRTQRGTSGHDANTPSGAVGQAPSQQETHVSTTPHLQRLAQMAASFDTHDADVDMPPSRGATPVAPGPSASTAPPTDESKTGYIAPMAELLQRAKESDCASN